MVTELADRDMLMGLQRCFVILAAVIAVVATVAPRAHAECARLGFEVNDYGKEGPARDAQQLLDRYITKWAAERGISNYTVGPKIVSCELFLDFILFDEHTCKAVADVCAKDGASAQAMRSTLKSGAGSAESMSVAK